MTSPQQIITHGALRAEKALVADWTLQSGLGAQERAQIAARGADLVRAIRASAKPGLMEVFLAEYGLSTPEGIALMSLAEALLRVPDAATRDALIEDKIAPADWGKHLGQSGSGLVNAASLGLFVTGKVLAEDQRHPLRAAAKRLGAPVIRQAVGRAMKEMGRQFVLGEAIAPAMARARLLEAKGFTYSYDMLGEAARTAADAQRYDRAYAQAIAAISTACTHGDIRRNPGISIKLSALHPRYEVAQRDRVMAELVPRVHALCRLAKAAGLGLNIDAEEADRLWLSLEVIEAVLAQPDLAGWDGFGVVVQAYGRRCGGVIDHLYALATRLDRRIMVRLVKGAYWDAEIKRAQVLGLESFPVLTRKAATDVSYITHARKLMGMVDRIYPQFAGHNAHTVAALLHLAQKMAVAPEQFEFQRLHGMGERLHEIVKEAEGTACRIYAPVGPHRDLLAYLVRRLLENGANSSFVHQIVDEAIAPEVVAACPFAALERAGSGAVVEPSALFGVRRNSQGFDLSDLGDLERIEAARAPWEGHKFTAGSRIVGAVCSGGQAVYEPSFAPVAGLGASGGDISRKVNLLGEVCWAGLEEVGGALEGARVWEVEARERAAVLRRAADLYEANFGQIFALLAREAGKVLADAVAELREAVDFLRYYAEGCEGGEARGITVCISPWNFPLAIFTGQVAAALACGNGVIAKPAQQTPLIADLAVRLLHEAGVPLTALQLVLGDGAQVGAALTRDARVAAVAFTGSTQTAQAIRRNLAEHAPEAVLIAETGGINAMIVDSTALPEQAVRDIVTAAFQSAGQRCSALRCLYLQEEIAPAVEEMLIGAMAELSLGDPWQLSTDVGPLIDSAAQQKVLAHLARAAQEARVIAQGLPRQEGYFVAPAAVRVAGIEEIGEENFGPVLHIARFKAGELEQVIEAINGAGYGLTFGLHSRIEARVQKIVAQVRVGNIYVNRNQIGAVVGSQPFGGEGLSGTGPKAGGPQYLTRLRKGHLGQGGAFEAPIDPARVARDLAALPVEHPPLSREILPGPTGESNQLSLYPRGPILCLGPGAQAVAAQVAAVRAAGGIALGVKGHLPPEALSHLQGFAAAVWWGEEARDHQNALARRAGTILPLIREVPDVSWVCLERHLCIDTTAAGGNAQLLASLS